MCKQKLEHKMSPPTTLQVNIIMSYYAIYYLAIKSPCQVLRWTIEWFHYFCFDIVFIYFFYVATLRPRSQHNKKHCQFLSNSRDNMMNKSNGTSHRRTSTTSQTSCILQINFQTFHSDVVICSMYGWHSVLCRLRVLCYCYELRVDNTSDSGIKMYICN